MIFFVNNMKVVPYSENSQMEIEKFVLDTLIQKEVMTFASSSSSFFSSWEAEEQHQKCNSGAYIQNTLQTGKLRMK